MEIVEGGDGTPEDGLFLLGNIQQAADLRRLLRRWAERVPSPEGFVLAAVREAP